MTAALPMICPICPRTHGYAWVCLGGVCLGGGMPGGGMPGFPVGKDAMGDKIGMGEGGPIIGALIKKALLTVGLFKTNVTADVLPPRCFYPPDVFTPQMFLPPRCFYPPDVFTT